MPPLDFQGRLNELVDALVSTYPATPHIHHLDNPCVPEWEGVRQAVGCLFDLLYPGFFHRKSWDANDPTEYARRQLGKLGGLLHAQISECLSYEAHDRAAAPQQPGAAAPEQQPAAASASTPAARAGEITLAFLSRLPAVRKVLADDVQAAYDGDPAARNTDEPVLCYPGVFAVSVYRAAHELHEMNVPLMPRMMTEYAHSVTGIDIHPGAKIGRHFFIDHGTGVVIGETTVIGNGCKLYQGVTLGALSFPKDERGRVIRGVKRHPTLEDGVTIYSNATVLGGDTVLGEGCVIGGNVFITSSVPPRTVVKGDHDVKITPRGKPHATEVTER
jgi:serine O-acetyltransferase